MILLDTIINKSIEILRRGEIYNFKLVEEICFNL